LQIIRPTGFKPQVDLDLFEACEQKLVERGKNQRGISRRRNPARYPLAMHVWDMTDRCGHPMYASTSGNRAIFTCGRYMKTSGAECEHNVVDGEAAFAFVLSVLKQKAEIQGGRDVLKARLRQLAASAAQPSQDDEALAALRLLCNQIAEAEDRLNLMGRNLALAKSEVAHAQIEAQLTATHEEVTKLKSQCEQAEKRIDHRKPG
jgi:hypothetical protein